MITCEKCQSEFNADYNQGYPGHVDPPGAMLAYTILFVIVGIILGIVYLVFRYVVFLIASGAFFGGALLALSHVREARQFCEQAGGGVCPSCGHENKVKWYS